MQAHLKPLSQKVSIFIVMALMMNITAPAYSQKTLWEKTQEQVSKGASTVSKAFKNIDISKGVAIAGKTIKEAARSTASKIGNSLSAQLDKLKNVAPKVIIPKLLENLEKLGQQIGYVTNCMFKGTCSEQERAAFIALSITVLALTIALVGLSITVAATSKEIEAKTVTVSEEVKGWSIPAIIARFKNTTAEFKQNLLTMQTCILKRQCTKAQKKGLYAFAIIIVVLTTILVGVGIGSYIYAQQKEKDREQDRLRAEAAATAAQRGQPLEKPLFPEEKKTEKPSLVTTLQEQAKSAVASVRDQAKAKLSELQELAKDWQSQIKEKVTPMQNYFQKQVIEKGTSAFQETATQIQNALAAQAQAAQQALKETVAPVQATLIEKARAANEKAKELAEKFLIDLEKSSRSFLDIALEKVLDIQLSLIEPAIQTVQTYTTRIFNAIKPLKTIRLRTQITELSKDIETLITKANKLKNQWPEAISQLTQRTPWINSHIRPVVLGGKTNEQIAKEAQEMFPLAYIADDIWNFYPKIVTQVNDFKLYGPAVIFDAFAKRVAELLEAIHTIHTSLGKVGVVIISKELADALEDLRVQMVQLATNLKTTANIKPILSNPPQSTAAALMEAFKGYVWRVGFGLPQKMNEHLTRMHQQYDQIMPTMEAIMTENEILQEISKNISSLLKADVIIRIRQQPLLNSARLPIVLAHSLGFIVSQIKAIINNIMIKTDTVIEGLSTILEDAKPLGELVNTAIGGNFINPAIITGLDAIKADVQAIQKTLQKVRNGITDSIQIPFSV